jgi:hypothetical protein
LRAFISVPASASTASSVALSRAVVADVRFSVGALTPSHMSDHGSRM